MMNELQKKTDLSILAVKESNLPLIKGASAELPQFSAKVSCGLFGISDDFIEKYQSLDSHFVKNKFSTFFFESDGDSMEPTIFAGQIMIVDKSRKDFHGKVSIVCWEDRLICKRVFLRSDSIILKSDNSKYQDIIISNNENILLWGLVVAIAGFVK
jgi:DNA polymerase V